MKVRSTALSIVLLAFSMASAQDNPTSVPTPVPATEPVPAQPARTMTWQGLAAELELTPEQVVDLERIDREYGELYKETNRKITDPEAKKARTVELRDRKQADIKAVLTKDQYKKWQAIKQEQRTSRSQSRQQVAPAHQE